MNEYLFIKKASFILKKFSITIEYVQYGMMRKFVSLTTISESKKKFLVTYTAIWTCKRGLHPAVNSQKFIMMMMTVWMYENMFIQKRKLYIEEILNHYKIRPVDMMKKFVSLTMISASKKKFLVTYTAIWTCKRGLHPAVNS